MVLPFEEEAKNFFTQVKHPWQVLVGHFSLPSHCPLCPSRPSSFQ